MILTLKDKSNNNSILIVIITLSLSALALILSPVISPDYYFYENDYNNFLQNSDSQDYFYELLKRIFRLFVSFDLFYFLLVSTIIFFKIKLFSYFSVSYIYFLPFYIVSFYILHDLIQFRLSLGLVLFLYSIYLYENKHLKKALIVFFISIFTHNSIIILLIPILVSKFSYKFIVIFLILIGLFFFNIDFELAYEFIIDSNLLEFSAKNADYLFELSKVKFELFFSKLAWLFLLNIILLKFIFFKYKIKSKLMRFEKFVFISFIFGIFFLSIFSDNMVLSNRLFELLIFYLPLMQGLCFYQLMKRSHMISMLYFSCLIIINFILFTNPLIT